jgi:hypothetical protein
VNQKTGLCDHIRVPLITLHWSRHIKEPSSVCSIM